MACVNADHQYKQEKNQANQKCKNPQNLKHINHFIFQTLLLVTSLHNSRCAIQLSREARVLGSLASTRLNYSSTHPAFP